MPASSYSLNCRSEANKTCAAAPSRCVSGLGDVNRDLPALGVLELFVERPYVLCRSRGLPPAGSDKSGASDVVGTTSWLPWFRLICAQASPGGCLQLRGRFDEFARH